MIIIGKSRAALMMICDVFASYDRKDHVIVYIYNNLNIGGEFLFSGFQVIETDKIAVHANKYLGAVMPETKRKLVELFPLDYLTLINKNSAVSGDSVILTGSIIDSLVSIAGGVTLGKYVTVYANSSIAHHATLGDFVTICPNVSICGDVKIGEGAFIGAGSVIKNGITIGKNCVIGCGSIVIHDVEDGKTVYGNPAREK